MPDTSVRLPASPCRRSPRSLRSAAAAVGVTGVLIVVMPLGLLLGKNGLTTASVNRAAPIPSPHLTDCDSGATVRSRRLSVGQCVKVVGAGFDPDEQIQVSESRTPGRRSFVRADGAGRFLLRYVAGAETGPDVLTFVGLNDSGSVAVPRVALCRFTVSAS